MFSLALSCWHLSCAFSMGWKPLPCSGLPWATCRGVFPAKESFRACLHLPPPPSVPLSFSGVPRCRCHGTLAPPLNGMALTTVDSDFSPTSAWPLLLPHLFLSVAFRTADLPPRAILLPWSGLSSGNTISLPCSRRSSSSCRHVTGQGPCPLLCSPFTYMWIYARLMMPESRTPTCASQLKPQTLSCMRSSHSPPAGLSQPLCQRF